MKKYVTSIIICVDWVEPKYLRIVNTNTCNYRPNLMASLRMFPNNKHEIIIIRVSVLISPNCRSPALDPTDEIIIDEVPNEVQPRNHKLLSLQHRMYNKFQIVVTVIFFTWYVKKLYLSIFFENTRIEFNRQMTVIFPVQNFPSLQIRWTIFGNHFAITFVFRRMDCLKRRYRQVRWSFIAEFLHLCFIVNVITAVTCVIFHSEFYFNFSMFIAYFNRWNSSIFRNNCWLEAYWSRE